MSALSYRTKVNFGVTAVVLLISAFFAVLAWDINPDSDEIIGPRFVPVFIVFLMVALGVLISIIALRQDVAPIRILIVSTLKKILGLEIQTLLMS